MSFMTTPKIRCSETRHASRVDHAFKDPTGELKFARKAENRFKIALTVFGLSCIMAFTSAMNLIMIGALQ